MTAATRSPLRLERGGPVTGPSRLVVLVALLLLAAVSADVRFGGPLTQLDRGVAARMSRWDLRDQVWDRRGLTIGVWFGQRGIVLVGSTLIAGGLAWRNRTTEPLVRLVVAIALLVVLVYAFKLGLARNAPIQDARGVPAGRGASFPSGHVANAILLWGLADWAVHRYAVPSPLPALIRGGRWIAPVAITVAMTLLNYHWLSDFLGGAAAGTVLLGLTLHPVWARVSAGVDSRWFGPRHGDAAR